MIFLYLNFWGYSQSNNDEKKFISRLSKTYENSNFNNDKYNKQLLYYALKRQNIPVDTICSYIYIPFYRVELKNLSCIKKRNLYKNHYFSYVSTKKLEFVEMYIFKSREFYGTLRDDVNNNTMHFVQGKLIEARATAFFHQIYEKVYPEMTIYIRRPSSEMFIIKDGKMNLITYEDNRWNIHDLNVFYSDKIFDWKKGWVERKGDKPLLWK